MADMAEVIELIEEIKGDVRNMEALLRERQRVLDAIPECPLHGHDCVPHALDWIAKAKAVMARTEE